MAKYTIHQAKSQLSKILQKVARGEEVIILNRDQPVAKVIPLTSSKRQLGTLKGKLRMTEDFDDTPSDFEDYLK